MNISNQFQQANYYWKSSSQIAHEKSQPSCNNFQFSYENQVYDQKINYLSNHNGISHQNCEQKMITGNQNNKYTPNYQINFANKSNKQNGSGFCLNNFTIFNEFTNNKSHIFQNKQQNEKIHRQADKSELSMYDKSHQLNQLQKEFHSLNLLQVTSSKIVYEETINFNTYLQIATKEEQLHQQCQDNSNKVYKSFSQEMVPQESQQSAFQFQNNNSTVYNSFFLKQRQNNDQITMHHTTQYLHKVNGITREDKNSQHYQPSSLILKKTEDSHGLKQQNKLNQIIMEEKISSGEEQQEVKDLKKLKFIERITNQSEEYWNEFSEEEDEYLLSLYEQIDKNNVNKNILSSFVKYILKKGDDVVVECLDLKQKELYKIRKELKNFTKNKKLNNNTIISFFDSKRYSNQFQYYLQFYATDYYQKSRVNDKISHFICITFFLRCFSNSKLRKNIIIYNKSKYFKTINKSRLNAQCSPL